jgi:hypothetical protein
VKTDAPNVDIVDGYFHSLSMCYLRLQDVHQLPEWVQSDAKDHIANLVQVAPNGVYQIADWVQSDPMDHIVNIAPNN